MSRFSQWKTRRLPADLARRLNVPGGYEVGAYLPVPVRRPNRTAAGMQFTNARRHGRALQSGDRISNDALALVVNGTTDRLRSLRAWHVQPGKCPCCGAKSGKLVLSDAGKLRLKAARARAVMK